MRTATKNIARIGLALVALIVLLLSSFAIRDKIAQNRRDARYGQILREYQARFPVGTSRKEVEDQLRADGTAFTQTCCSNISYTRSDEFEIGRDPGSWVCNYFSEMIEIEFDRPTNAGQGNASDTVKQIQLKSRSGPCL